MAVAGMQLDYAQALILKYCCLYCLFLLITGDLRDTIGGHN